MFGLYALEGPEIALREMQLFQMPWSIMFATFLICSYIIPVPMWMFSKVRRSVPLMIFTTILVNIGMWCERFIIIVPGLARKQGFSFTWCGYTPSAIEITIVIGTFAMVSMLCLLFA